MKSVDEIMATLPPEAFRWNDTRFCAKLSFAERCAVAAFFLKGVPKRQLAAAFNLNRRTVSHIINVSSPHYKNVRQEIQKWGEEEFCKMYITESMAMRVANAAKSPDMEKTYAVKDAEPSHRVPNKNAKAKAGIQIAKSVLWDRTHRIEIAFRDGKWMWHDHDEPMFTDWYETSEPGTMTSTLCWQMFLQDQGAEEA